MPLKRAQWGAPYEETKSVCFPMVDTDTGEQISLEVHSHAFSLILDKRRICLLSLRLSGIEDIASRKYDAGERPPIITTREG